MPPCPGTSPPQSKIRVVVAKPGLDGHDRGAKIIARVLREQGIDDVVITVGGTIPAEDIPQLKVLGVAEVFTPGAPTQVIVDFIRGATGRADGAAPGAGS